jgi:hypothetical protein
MSTSGRVNSRAGTQQFGLDDSDSGEGLAIFFSQGGESVARYRVRVLVCIDQGVYDMGEFYISPPVVTAAPPGSLSRMVAAAICPGATGWRVSVTPMVGPGGSPPPEDETANIVLASSKCCSSPIGVSRVGERYGYISGTAISPTVVNYSVLAGQTITGIAALGLTGGGSYSINGGTPILIPAGSSANIEPQSPIPPNSVITFDNVDFMIEFKESA